MNDKQIIKKLTEELEEATKPKWVSVEEIPVNGHYGWEVGERAIAFNGYVFEIEWDGEDWCSIGGDDFTHWMKTPEDPQ